MTKVEKSAKRPSEEMHLGSTGQKKETVVDRRRRLGAQL